MTTVLVAVDRQNMLVTSTQKSKEKTMRSPFVA